MISVAFISVIIILTAWLKSSLGSTGSISIPQLISSMSLESKIGQMVQIDISYFILPGTASVNYTLLHDYILKYEIGSILNSPFSGGPVPNSGSGWTASQWRQLIAKIQQFASETTSKVPIMYGIDSIHGATFVQGAALFPASLNIAATFNPVLPLEAGKVTSKDTRAAGIPWIFNPVLGLGLQPLWARFDETFGEDPYLAATMGANLINGLQFKWTAEDATLGYPTQTAACMKHFIGYSMPEDGHDRSPVQLPDRLLRELYIPSFQAAIDAGVLTAMESYQEIGGVPMVSSEDYLTTLIRKEMGFTGFLVTDYAEIENLHNWHLVAATQRDAVKLAMLDTTIDMSMVPLDSSFYEYLLDLVNSGEVSVDRIDASVTRILQVKQALGLLDHPTISADDPITDTVGAETDWQLSLNASRESIVLAKNMNNILPLGVGTKVLVTGPTCNSSISQTGGWAIHWQGAFAESELSRRQTVISGLLHNSVLTPEDVFYFPGVSISAGDLSDVDLDAVSALASAVDVIVACVGEGTYAEKPGDIDDLYLGNGQVEYVQYLATLDKPVVLVAVEGRPRLMHDAVNASQAVILAMQPGPLGGQAIAEVITGLVVPSGRLPFTYPLYEANMIYPYHHKYGDQCTTPTGEHTVAYIQCPVEFSFGDGLSYTTFKYSDLTLSKTTISEDDELTVSVTVTNSGGAFAAKHAVMLFLFDMYRRVTPEYKLLKRFDKIDLLPGESRVVSFTLSRLDLQYVGIDSRYILESGQYRVGLHPSVDCRSNDQANWDISTQDTTSAAVSMCREFNFTVSSAYHPVCDVGCNLWSVDNGGICGLTVDPSQCRSTCIEQAWTWDYVDCITQYYQEICYGAESIKCYDAFNFLQPVVSNDDVDCSAKDSSYSGTFIIIYSVMIGLIGFFAGSLVILWAVYKGLLINCLGLGKSSMQQSLLRYSHVKDEDDASNEAATAGAEAGDDVERR